MTLHERESVHYLEIPQKRDSHGRGTGLLLPRLATKANMARDRIELPTRGFSVLCSTDGGFEYDVQLPKREMPASLISKTFA